MTNQGDEEQDKEKNEDKEEKNKLRSTVREERHIYGKYGSLEDVLPFQRENNDDKRGYKYDIEEEHEKKGR